MSNEMKSATTYIIFRISRGFDDYTYKSATHSIELK